MPTFRFPLFIVFLCLLGGAAAHAQRRSAVAPRPTPAVTPSAAATVPPPLAPNLPGEPGTLSATAPGGVVNGAPTPEQASVTLEFLNQPVADVIAYYENLTGKQVIAENSVAGSISLRITTPVTPSRAARMIETALYVNGFDVLQPDPNENVVTIIGLGKPPRNFGVPIYFEPEDLPDNSQVVTLFVRLDNLDPQETSGLLGSYVPPNATVAFTPFPKARALLITDTARSVRRLYDLVKRLDKQGASVHEEFIKLERADATKAVEFLKSVFETKDAVGNAPAATAVGVNGAAIPGSTIRRPIRRIGEDGNPVEGAGLVTTANGGLALNRDSLIVGKVTLTPDVRTNRVHVVTTDANMEIIRHLLAEYDTNTAFAAPVRFPLKFIRPDQLLPILVQSLQENGDEKNGGTPGVTNPNKNGQANANNSGSQSSSFGGGSSLGGSGGLGGLGSLDSSINSSTESIDTTPQEVTVGNNRLIADISNSSIILLGGVDARDKVAQIIAQLDRRSPQVMIHTIIGELSLGKDRELGFQYLLRTKRLGLTNNANLFTSNTVGATPAPSASPATATSTLDTLGQLATGLGTSFSGVGGVIAVGRSLDIILAALESTTRFKTISRPEITTLNFKRATIESGQTVSISTGSVGSLATTGNTTGVYNQTTQVPATLKLEVTPQINSDKEVLMQVDQTLNSPLGTSSTINGAASQQLSIRHLQNWVSARNGETVVLGGLITQSDNISDSNIPYLSRIPVLGNLFKSHTRDANRSELIILMQPEVVDTAGVMATLREREEGKTYLGHELDHQLDPIEVRKAVPVKRARPVPQQTPAYVPTVK